MWAQRDIITKVALASVHPIWTNYQRRKELTGPTISSTKKKKESAPKYCPTIIYSRDGRKRTIGKRILVGSRNR